MSNFFVETDMFNHRIELCRSCEFYYKPTGTCKKCGCFMKIKASIGIMKCPINKWLQVGKKNSVDELPEHLQKEIQDIAPDIVGGVAKDVETKKKLVTLHNTIYGTRYKITTSCSTCLNDCYKGITRLIK